LAKPGQASAFKRVMRHKVALPILNMAVWLQRQEDILQTSPSPSDHPVAVPCPAGG
jgi:hypothetical protein